jgi:predicted kinase
MAKYPLILLCGMSGSGKSTTATHLEQQFEHCDILHPEWIRQELGITRYSRADTPQILTIEMQRLRGLWKRDRTGIIDNNLLSPILRQMFYDLARDEGVPVLLICLSAPRHVLEERIAARPYIEGGPPNEPKILDRQYMFWREPTMYDACLNDSENVTMVVFDTVKQGVTCIQGDITPYYAYLQVLIEIKEKLDAG